MEQEDEEWTLEHLYGEMSAEDNLPSLENVASLVEELHDTWCNNEVGASGMLEFAARMYDIDINDLSQCSFERLSVANKRQLFAIAKLKFFCEQYKILEGEVHERLSRVTFCIQHSKDLLYDSALLFHRMDVGRENGLPDSAPIENIIHLDEEKNTNFQKLVFHLCKLFQVAELRKVEDKCFKEIISQEGYHTHAWKEYTIKVGSKDVIVDIDRFVRMHIRKEDSMEYWRCLTNPTNNCKNIVEHFTNTEELEFPSLITNRYLQSWSNGIYNMDTDMFFPYDKKDEWSAMAEAIEDYRVNDLGWVGYTCSPPNNEDVSIKYFDQPFRFEITPEVEAKFDVDSIPLPELELLFNTQNLTKGTQDWMLIFLARLFFPVLSKDKWQVILFIKGVAGSGKSTIAKLIRECFQTHQVTTLSTNIEQKFGLSALYKGLICICAEVRADFGLNQADWQSAASGEEVSISEKYKTAFTHRWDTPMLFLGNEYPNYKNSSGSVDRRMFMCEFNKKVKSSDPQLFEKMIGNLDLFIRKSNVKYQAAVREHGTKDIWAEDPKILPEQMWEFRESMKSNVDRLHGFLTSGVFMYDITYYMPLDVFKTMYEEYCRKNGLEKARWTKDHYQTPFEECGLSMQVASLDYGGKQVRANFVRGLKVREDMMDSS